jgi:hypothetical protein
MNRLSKFVALPIAILTVAIGLAIGILTFSEDARHYFISSKLYGFLAYTYNEIRPYMLYGNNESCISDLTTETIKFSPVAETHDGSCTVKSGVRITSIGRTKILPSAILTCSMAKSLLEWEEYVQAIAKDVLASNVAEIRHIGTYNCRALHAMPMILSEHAYANAIDIIALKLENGKEFTIKANWNNNTESALFLTKIAVKACNSFSLALTPNSNRAHADHFHFDNGIYLGGDC